MSTVQMAVQMVLALGVNVQHYFICHVMAKTSCTLLQRWLAHFTSVSV
jgi:hypothetical protein